MMRFMVHTCVGCAVSIVAIALMFGGSGLDIVECIFATVVATGGAALLLWVLFWFVVGWIAVTVPRLLISKRLWAWAIRPRNAPTVGDRNAAVKAALTQYLQTAQARGMRPEKAEQLLNDRGWNRTDIETAKRELDSTTSQA